MLYNEINISVPVCTYLLEEFDLYPLFAASIVDGEQQALGEEQDAGFPAS